MYVPKSYHLVILIDHCTRGLSTGNTAEEAIRCHEPRYLTMSTGTLDSCATRSLTLPRNIPVMCP